MIKRMCLMLPIATFLLIGFIPANTQQVSAKEGPLTSTPILELYVDTSKLGIVEPGGAAVVLPVKVSYFIPAPALPEFIGKILLFGLKGLMIVPSVKVHLEVINKPDWMDVSISTPDVYLIPEINKKAFANTSISISLYKDAPAQPYTLILKATSSEVGRVESQFTTAQFKITPGYIPLVTITTSKPIMEAGPMTTLTYPIKIVNNANKETVVRLVSIDDIPGWATKPSQYQLVIPQGSEATLSISVTTPYNFGWIAGQMQTINMKFIVLPSPPPLSYEETPSNTYLYSIGIRSGSLPMIGLIAGIVVVIVIILFILITLLKKGIPLKVGKKGT